MTGKLSLRCQVGHLGGWGYQSLRYHSEHEERGELKEDEEVEKGEEFSSRPGVFSFGHVEFGENSQTPMPSRQWKNRLGTSEGGQNPDKNPNHY